MNKKDLEKVVVKILLCSFFAYSFSGAAVSSTLDEKPFLKIFISRN
jgi:hypothetical protein